MATTTDYINQLKTDKTNLVNNLIEKGVSAMENETFTSLVPKILDIETGITPTGTIEITENGTYDVSDKASANVNVPNIGDIKINNASYLFYSNARVDYINELCACITDSNTTCYNMFYNCTSLTTIPQLDTSNVTTMSYMFNSCINLQTIPQLDTSNVTTMSNMFNSCPKLQTIPQLDTSKVKDMGNMLRSCKELQTIPQLDTSNVGTMYNMFRDCSKLTTIPQLDTSSVTDVSSMFSNCSSLTTLGGFLNLGQAYSTTASANDSYYTLNLSTSKLLTHDSLMNVINNLYDIATKGCNTQMLRLGSTNISKLSADEIAIATNKGFSVS